MNDAPVAEKKSEVPVEDQPVPEGHPGIKSSLATFDLDSLYQIETYTDLVHGDIRVLIPVNAGRTRDTRRDVRYFSSITIDYRGRKMPVNFEIPAKNLEDAIAHFAETGQGVGTKMIEQLESMDRRASILIPGAMPPQPH